MNTSSINYKSIARNSLNHAERILVTILPHGRREGNEWVAINPRRNDHNLGSFRINMSTGRWADFAVDARGGDLISLVAYLEDLPQSKAARRIFRMIGGHND